jgi:outer membrane protein
VRLRTLDVSTGIEDGIGLFITLEPTRFTELSLTWFARPSWAIELAATVPQSHSVKSAGFEVGQLRQLPPTLVLQYHFTGWRVRPYLQAGISYTLVSNLRFAPAVQSQLQPTLRNRSIGPVWGLGAELPLAGGWSMNADFKQLKLATDIEALAPGLGYFRVKPRLASVGLGYRF